LRPEMRQLRKITFKYSMWTVTVFLLLCYDVMLPNFYYNSLNACLHLCMCICDVYVCDVCVSCMCASSHSVIHHFHAQRNITWQLHLLKEYF
jgi:hypothetical protein